MSQAAGGFVDSEGYVNGALGVARVLGDFHLEMKDDRPDGQPGPLTGTVGRGQSRCGSVQREQPVRARVRFTRRREYY
eukprot:1195625-Prorocentrum_minimum.AAC.4